MALRNLTNWSDPLFRKKSRPVEKFDERLWALLDDMLETLIHVSGYGCAAVHVGILRRVFVPASRSTDSLALSILLPTGIAPDL